MSEQGTMGGARPEKPAMKWARPLVWLALLVAVSAPLLVLAGALGTKFGLWDWRTGLLTLTIGAAPKAALAGLAAGVVALGVAAFAGFRRLWPMALAALLIPSATLAAFASVRAGAGSVPPIHDYATDWTPPLMPSAALLSARGPGANPVEADPRVDLSAGRPEVENWADGRIARIGGEACPNLKPVIVTLPPAEATARVRAVMESQKMAVLGDTPSGVEATATSFWYGFEDDVIARVRPEGAGSRVDFRSVSRVGQSDLGANCERLTELVTALR